MKNKFLRQISSSLVPGILAVTSLFSAATGAIAQDISLDVPLDCAPGDGCMIWQYVDQSPDKSYVDYKCSIQSYDGHKGTDFRVSYQAMLKGVPVKASASGVVRGARDGMRDIFVKDIGLKAVKGRECGNGLILDHGDGWTTQYCHMRRGSVRVKKGDRVKAGQIMGLVGMSGAADFPHIHIGVKKNNKVIDPFDPTDSANCRASAAPLWKNIKDEVLRYLERPIVELGFTPVQISFGDVRKGLRREMVGTPQDEVLLLYAAVANLHPGDQVYLQIKGPNGKIFAKHITEKLDRKKAAYRTRIGKKRRTSWAKGRYIGEARVISKTGKVVSILKAGLTIR